MYYLHYHNNNVYSDVCVSAILGKFLSLVKYSQLHQAVYHLAGFIL